jgi:uncharacterized caspase-like protein
MRIVIALTTLVPLAIAVPALAQSPGAQPQQSAAQGGPGGRVHGMANTSGNSPRNAAEQERNARAVEKAYNETIKHIPTQRPADPWGKMR